MCFLNNSQCFNNIIYGLVLVRLHEYHTYDTYFFFLVSIKNLSNNLGPQSGLP